MAQAERKSLLVVSCSRRKLRAEGTVPAMERYDGVNYRIVRKVAREGWWPEGVDLLILSAKHGLLEPDAWIEDYDQVMTPERARELWSDVCAGMATLVQTRGYEEVFLNLGRNYRLAIERWETRLNHRPRVIYAPGGIGQKASAMLRWLRAKVGAEG